MLADRTIPDGKLVVPTEVHRFTANEDLIDRLFLIGKTSGMGRRTFFHMRSGASELRERVNRDGMGRPRKL
jgi:hypothetical protein